ncbi:NUDIX domain-containing protein [Alicyclobacillus sp. SO9]|uniref:NUDIX hydrolase n=1 Tax=Alicyclobacillus sp. SO9 TaxID=2665646 RepID=UPI0018E87781|nr:NUDIX domain-containing protein [Alicyclobacillus sp. SO9]QQE77133.1 NUDIX domain-containing protein [Alicyclobacillus sp. SO9]
MQQSPSNDSVPIRPAASLLVLKSTANGVEVLTLQRAKNMRFLPGFLSFPGGAIDDGDYLIARERWSGTLQQQENRDDAVYAAGALRECAEETGMVFALMDTSNRPCALALPAPEQGQLLSGQMSFMDFLNAGPWWIAGGALRFVGSWTTPPGVSSRYETRFFACQADEATARIRINEQESAWGEWRDPAQLLQQIQAGTAKAAPPTVAMLKALTECASAEECMSKLTVLPPSPEELARLARNLMQQ